MSDNYDALQERGFSDQDIEQLPVDELIGSMREWCRKNAIGKGFEKAHHLRTRGSR